MIVLSLGQSFAIQRVHEYIPPTVHRGGKGKLSLHTTDQRALESLQGRNLRVLIQDNGKVQRSSFLRKPEPMDVILAYLQEVDTMGEGINFTELFKLVWDETGL
jgi:hypothetical protein